MDGALPAMRRQVVKAIREGQDVASVAAAYVVNVCSVFRWLTKAVKDLTPLRVSSPSACGRCRWSAH